MPEAPVVLYERRGPVAYVTMNRPRYRNAQNSAMTYALDDAFYRAADDPEVRVVVLAGAGEHFSVNRAEDLQGLHTGMDSVFGLHHPAHAHHAETAADSLGGMNVSAMKSAALKEANG
ncbi:enoyl-CoA hydratase-related protein [Streptomyces sp. NRRL F-2580]|uniref:enoyl-CoA hydratase-related protein n=1 Tax=Streptomyces sp. NRRL F-2580 TaxID=1463841 RepID=UPI0004C4F81E|nr:enoyl-CoA hydratase-related protein [Streptomyces sp. NRRL F-2580]